MHDTALKAERFRKFHVEGGAFVIPNPWDVGSARLLAQAGFQALATTSAGLAFSQGLPDNAVTRDGLLEHLRQLVPSTSLPISADLENGYGATPTAVNETFRLALATGVVGCSIEDSTNGHPNGQFELAQAQDRVRAAVDAARALPYPVMLTARAENFFIGRPDLADTIRRLQAYQEAGADVLYAPGLRNADEIRTVVESVDRPVNVMMGGGTPALTIQQLASLGVKRISVGGTFARFAYGALLHAAQEVMQSGTFDYGTHPIGQVSLSKLFRESADYQAAQKRRTNHPGAGSPG